MSTTAPSQGLSTMHSGHRGWIDTARRSVPWIRRMPQLARPRRGFWGDIPTASLKPRRAVRLCLHVPSQEPRAWPRQHPHASWGSSSLSRARASSRVSRGAKGVMCQSFRGVGETSPAPEPWLRPSPRAHLTQGTRGSMLIHTHIAAVDAPSARLLYIHGRMGVCSGVWTWSGRREHA